MRIGIDAHFVGVRRSGNEQYFENLIRALLRQPADGSEYFVFSYRGAAQTRIPDPRARHVPLASRSVWWQRGFEIPKHAWRLRLDVVHLPFNFLPLMRCRTVVTIHDLGFLRVPHAYAPAERWRMRLLTRLAARQADHVVTGSEFAKRDLMETYALSAKRITVAPNAVDGSLFRRLPAAAVLEGRQRLRLPDQYLLFVGVIQARKNLTVLVDALATLRAGRWPELHLVLAGREGYGAADVFRRARERGVESAVKHLGVVSDAELVVLYNGARAFVFPSLFEGFGLPLLEAMSCGCPVVSSNVTSLPEVYDGAALSFDPENVAELGARIAEVLGDPALAEQLCRRGIERAAQFSWDQTATIVRQAYGAA